VLLVVDLIWGLNPLLQVISNVIWIIFTVDFVVTFTLANPAANARDSLRSPRVRQHKSDLLMQAHLLDFSSTAYKPAF